MSSHLRDATFVFGASGFVGRRVLLAARRRALLDAQRTSKRPAIVISASREPERGLPDDRSGLVAVPFDVVDRGGPRALLDHVAPRRVILLAALSKPKDCDAYPGYARALNEELPGRVARWCAGAGARLVHVSTDLVFGAEPPRASGFDEDDEPAPVSAYGRTKLAGEDNVRSEHADALIARLALCWDERGAGCGAPEPLLDVVERRAEEPPTLFTDEWRTPLHVADAAEALVELAYGDASGVLHVAGSERITRYDLGCTLLVASGMSFARARELVRGGTRADAGMEATRPGDVCLDASRARAVLGYALPGVSSAVARFVRRASASDASAGPP